MPRKANNDLGECICYGKSCHYHVPVRRQGESGPLYLFCNNKDTCAGTKHFNQNYIMENAKMFSKPPLAQGEEPVKVKKEVEKIGPAKETPVKVVRREKAEKVEPQRVAKPAGVREEPPRNDDDGTGMGSGRSFLDGFDTLIG